MAKGKGGFLGQDGLNAPNQPTGVSATAGDAQATVSWTAPSNTGSSGIVGYSVQDSAGVGSYNYSYSMANASYDNVSVATLSARPFGLGFSSDGTRMYICDDEYSGVLGIIQKALSTAWNVSTAASDGSLDVSAKDTAPMDIAFKSDGTVMFFVGDSSNSVHA